MQSYTLLAVFEDDDEKLLEIVDTLNLEIRLERNNMMTVCDPERLKSVALKNNRAIPFFTMVSDYESLVEEVAKKSPFIVYDAQDVLNTAFLVMNNNPVKLMLGFGSDSRYKADFVAEAMPNHIMNMVYTLDGRKIFTFPSTAEYTRENIIDALVHVTSYTDNSFYDQDKPLVLVRASEEFREGEICRIASHLRINLVIAHSAEEAFGIQNAAVLMRQYKSGEMDYVFSLGLPFLYINTERNYKGLASVVKSLRDADFGGIV